MIDIIYRTRAIKADFSEKNLLEKMFLTFKKWVKNIQTAGYNGTYTIYYQPSYNTLHTMKSSDPLLLADGTLG